MIRNSSMSMKPGLLLKLICILGLGGSIGFSQEIDEHLSVSGAWKWSFTMPDGSKIEPRARLYQEADKLTGITRFRPGMESDISEGKVSGNELSFVVVRERDGHKVTTTYKGVRTGNHIKGTIESDWNGTMQSYEWDARRVSKDPTGTWVWAMANRNGQTNETRLTLKQEQEKLTGLHIFREVETEIEEGQIRNGEISFKVIREIDEDTTLISSYKGRIVGEVIRGRIEVTGGERDRLYIWEAKRIE